MIGYFWLCLPRGTWQVTAQHALDAAVAEGDLLGEAAMYYSLGYTLWDQGRLGDSAFHHTRAVELHQAIDWRPGVGAALSGLGWVEWELARLDDALGNFSAAIEILREYGQSVAEALALIGVGMVHRDMGRLQDATRDLELALLVRRKAIGGSYEANHLDNLAIVYWENGRLRDALDVLGRPSRSTRPSATATATPCRCWSPRGCCWSTGGTPRAWRWPSGRWGSPWAPATGASSPTRSTPSPTPSAERATGGCRPRPTGGRCWPPAPPRTGAPRPTACWAWRPGCAAWAGTRRPCRGRTTPSRWPAAADSGSSRARSSPSAPRSTWRPVSRSGSGRWPSGPSRSRSRPATASARRAP
ncbi:tetratricopeptide repeat protein [Streptomyces sp. M19]